MSATYDYKEAIDTIWIIPLYFTIGAVYGTIMTNNLSFKATVLQTIAISLSWPLTVISFVLTITLSVVGLITKIFLRVFSKPIIYILLLISFFIISCSKSYKVNAATITGDTPLAGISVLFAEKARQGITWYDPDDLELLAQVLEHENYSNGEYSMYLTGAVVINRRNSPKWPNTIHDVIYQTNPRQYSTTDKFWSRPVHQDCYRIASWLLIFGCPDVPPNVVYQATFKQGSGVYKHEGDYFCYE